MEELAPVVFGDNDRLDSAMEGSSEDVLDLTKHVPWPALRKKFCPPKHSCDIVQSPPASYRTSVEKLVEWCNMTHDDRELAKLKWAHQTPQRDKAKISQMVPGHKFHQEKKKQLADYRKQLREPKRCTQRNPKHDLQEKKARNTWSGTNGIVSRRSRVRAFDSVQKHVNVTSPKTEVAANVPRERMLLVFCNELAKQKPKKGGPGEPIMERAKKPQIFLFGNGGGNLMDGHPVLQHLENAKQDPSSYDITEMYQERQDDPEVQNQLDSIRSSLYSARDDFSPGASNENTQDFEDVRKRGHGSDDEFGVEHRRR